MAVIVGAIAGWLVAGLSGIVADGAGAAVGALFMILLMAVRYMAISRARRAHVDDAFEKTLADMRAKDRARPRSS